MNYALNMLVKIEILAYLLAHSQKAHDISIIANMHVWKSRKKEAGKSTS